MYLSYDIKGIQKFIFSVPRLKCVIGASGLIVNFDNEAEQRAKEVDPTVKKIVSAGGRGVFYCDDLNAAHNIEIRLVEAAWKVGLDIQIGIDPQLSCVIHRADRFYAYTPDLPSDTRGKIEPCSMSGLWPVVEKTGKGANRDVHPMIWERVEKSRHDDLGTFIIEKLQQYQLVPDILSGFKLQFFRNVSPDPEDIGDEGAAALVGQAALGSRNRWAVIAMDGNDIGSQFQALERDISDPDTLAQKFSEMSEALKTCTLNAFLKALGHTMETWARDVEPQDGGLAPSCVGDSNTLILPFRPLLLGGDDITILCHASYAMSFAQEMAQGFQDESKNSQFIWPATGGMLTMSAGILYTKTSFPLHMAIPYAEELLRSAKNRFRDQTPTPSAVDWDSVTETLVETPEARRQSELFFRDRELDMEIGLTQRPYTLTKDGPAPKLNDLLTLKSELVDAQVSSSVLARVLPALKRPWSERIAFIASLAKRHDILKQQLWEGKPLGTGWIPSGHNNIQVTGFPDALLLLEEEHRMTQTTTDA